jgi:site-specific DNA recombinase
MTKRTKQNTTHPQRAGVYIRVSSEQQADPDKVSPQAQEADCRAFCQQRGYSVSEVYRDTERYRVGKRMVEPSGTRSDRPQLKRMLADARAGRFDVIVAWREDRLYRGYRPMLDVLDCLDETELDVELVKEHFDRNIAPVKAWAARMELDAKHDRFMMGIAGRLAKGLPWLPNPPYGYAKRDGKIVAHEPEARWVRKMWAWWADGVPGREIRRRLIAGGAAQRRASRHAWTITQIYRMFRTEFYYTGKIPVEWDGKEYLCDIPPLIDADTGARAQERSVKWKKYPAGNLNTPALAAGLVYCQKCGWKMTMIGRKNNGKLYQYYRCCAANCIGERPADCAGEVAMGRVDRETWDKLWGLFSDREEFERRLQEYIAAAKAQAHDAGAELGRLKEKIGKLDVQRPMVITSWRLGEITKADRDIQLAAIAREREELEIDVYKTSLTQGDQAGKLTRAAELFRLHAVTGFEKINVAPETPEQAALQFEARRKLVEAFVTKVTIKPDKQVEVQTEFDIDPEQPIGVADWPGNKISEGLTYYQFS